jgi:hypothetical protein
MRRRVWVIVAIILIMSTMGGCSVDKGTNPRPPELDRKTPENLINYLADAYERRDIEKYGESLADDFLFVFTSADADSLGLPPDQPWWGKTPELASTTRMFEDAEVTAIEMDLPISAGPWSTEDGLGYKLEPSIKVTVESAGSELPTTYWVFKSWLFVEVIVDPKDEGLWVFKEIEERIKEGEE